MIEAAYTVVDQAGNKYRIRCPISTSIENILLAAERRHGVKMKDVIDEDRVNLADVPGPVARDRPKARRISNAKGHSRFVR